MALDSLIVREGGGDHRRTYNKYQNKTVVKRISS
jgi:hypothetical protein